LSARGVAEHAASAGRWAVELVESKFDYETVLPLSKSDEPDLSLGSIA
jgi:hypothetical protein